MHRLKMHVVSELVGRKVLKKREGQVRSRTSYFSTWPDELVSWGKGTQKGIVKTINTQQTNYWHFQGYNPKLEVILFGCRKGKNFSKKRKKRELLGASINLAR